MKRSLAGAAVLAVLVAAVVVAGQEWHGRSRASPPASASATRTSSPAPAANAGSSSRTHAVAALLRRRAAAVRDGDRTSFLAGIDPAASSRFRTAQRKLFENLREVPLSTWKYRLDQRETTDTARLREGSRGADELWAPKVQLVYGLTGVDTRPTRHSMGYLFVRRGDRWYLRSDTALGKDKTWRGPWDFGPCRVLRTRSGLVLYHPGGKHSAEAVAAQLDRDVRGVRAVWGRDDWSGKVAVLVPKGHRELRALVGREFSVDTIAAVAVADAVDTEQHIAKGQRVVLNPAEAARLSGRTLAVTMRHEITHIAARADTVDGAPMWLLEGFADYVGYAAADIAPAKAAPDLAGQVRAGELPGGVPGDDDFRAESSDLDLAYQQAWTLCHYIAHQYGQSRLVRFYRAAVRYGHLGNGKLDKLLHQHFGTDTEGLVGGWRGYLRAKLG